MPSLACGLRWFINERPHKLYKYAFLCDNITYIISQNTKGEKSKMTATNEKWVEACVHYEMPMDIPYRGKDGEISFKTINAAPNDGVLNIKVPEYATESEEALVYYLTKLSQFNNWVFINANLWIDGKEGEDGYFKWKLNFDNYDD